MKLIDHRGFVPFSIQQKTSAAITGTSWVRTGFGGTATDLPDINIHKYAAFYYDIVLYEPPHPCAAGGGGGGSNVETYLGTYEQYSFDMTPQPNMLRRERYRGQPFVTEAQVHISANTFGPPPVLAMFSDDVVINQALAEVSVSATYSRQEWHWSFDGCPPEGDGWVEGDYINITTPTSVSYSFLALKVGGGVELIGSFPVAGNGETSIIDITSVIQEMWSRRNDASTVGYATIAGLAPVEGGVQDIISSMRLGLTAINAQCGTCPVWDETVEIVEGIQWSNPQVGTILINVGYLQPGPGDVVETRFPAMN